LENFEKSKFENAPCKESLFKPSALKVLADKLDPTIKIAAIKEIKSLFITLLNWTVKIIP
jgi:hypothetical protein